MANVMDCVMVENCYAKDGSYGAYGDSAGYAGAYSVGYYTYCLKFRTPAFGGISERITLNIKLSKVGSSSTTLRYALCTSDANKDRYTSASGVYGEVTDENQLAQGVVSWSGIASGTVHSLSIETDQMKPGTVYYLLLWSYYSKNSISTTVTVQKASVHTASIECGGGIIQIQHNGEILSCLVDIAKEGVWVQAVPEVAQGGVWKTGS